MKQTIENSLIKAPRLLIVEDDRQQLAQMVDWLSQREGSVYQARSSEQAQDILNQEWVDAVITDWQLPGRSGLDLIRDLRQAGFAGPLLICTGLMLSPADLRAAFDAGVDDYLRKPLNDVELNTRLNNSLQLYAHRRVLDLYATSQTEFIQFMSRKMGAGLDHMGQLHRLIAAHAEPSPEQCEASRVNEDLSRQFYQCMEWARFRFALHHIQFQRFELKQLLKSMEARFPDRAGRLLIRGGKDLFLHSDPDLLQRVLWQLIDNALRYSAGQVKLEISLLDDQRLRLMIKDSGEQLNEGQVEELLSPRQRGLGLHICQDLLRILGSTLVAQKGRKGDTQIYFELKL